MRNNDIYSMNYPFQNIAHSIQICRGAAQFLRIENGFLRPCGHRRLGVGCGDLFGATRAEATPYGSGRGNSVYIFPPICRTLLLDYNG
jgi:hypothetical protein